MKNKEFIIRVGQWVEFLTIETYSDGDNRYITISCGVI